MKKSFLLIVMMMLAFTLTGCYNPSRGSRFGKLTIIEFYDENYQEIEGNYYNRYGDMYYIFDEFKTNLVFSMQPPSQPLNAPAPIDLYYTATIQPNQNIIVRFKIKQNNDYVFSSLVIDSKSYLREDAHHFEVDGEYANFDLLIENVNEDRLVFMITTFYMEKEVDGEMKYFQGSTYYQERTYLRGFAFVLEEDSE